MTKGVGLNGPLFFLGYLPFMLATYVLPYGGSNSAVVQGLAAGTNAPQAGHFQLLFLLHLGSVGALCLLTWLRGNGADKGWIVIFPLLAGVFDLVPGLNWIPLVPTAMHVCALVTGARARAIDMGVPASTSPMAPEVPHESSSPTAQLPNDESFPAVTQPTPSPVAAPMAEPQPARSGLGAATIYSAAVVLVGVGLAAVLGVQQYIDAQQRAEQKLTLARDSMLREQEQEREQSRQMLAAAEAQRAQEAHERQRLEGELRQQREAAAAQDSEQQARQAQAEVQAAVERQRQQEAMEQAAAQAQRNIETASFTQLLVNNQNCADQDLYLNSQRLGTVARESTARFQFPSGQYDVRFCAVRSNNCGDARTVFFPAGGQQYIAYRHPNCR